MKIQIIPSILSANFAELGTALHQAEEGGAEIVQVDVMDGHFVPNLTVGPPVIADLRRATSLMLDVHLMIDNPGESIEAYIEAGADILTVHVEACRHLHRVVHRIKEAGVKAGVALNPATPLVMLEDILPDLDVALIMTVNPGFGGQAFIHSTLPKIRRLRGILDEKGLDHIILEVDGGVNEESAFLLGEAGATGLVAGSAVYGGGQSVGERIRRLRDLAEEGRRGR